MKGSVAKCIVNGLDTSELQVLLARIASLQDSAKLQRLCDYLMEPDPYSDARVMQRLGIKRHTKDALLNQLGELLLTFNGGSSPGVNVAGSIDMATRLVKRMEYEAAKAVIVAGIRLAEGVGNYQAIIEFWDIVDCFHEVPEIVAITQSEARRQMEAIAELSRITDAVIQARRMPTPAGREDMLRTLMERAIALGNDINLSPKGGILQYKQIVKCHLLLDKPELALPIQEELVTLILAHPNLSTDLEQALAREFRNASHIAWLAKDRNKFVHWKVRLDSLKTSNPNAEFEKRLRVSFILAVAIETGDTKAGDEACREFLKSLEDGTSKFPVQFIVESLYRCAYHYLTNENYKAMPRVFSHFNSIARTGYHTKQFVLYTLIRTIYLIDTHDWEEAEKHLKKLGDPKFLEDVPGLDIATFFLEEIVGRKLGKPAKEGYNPAARLDQLRNDLQGFELVEYFDLPTWYESRYKEIPMADIFRHRASLEGWVA